MGLLALTCPQCATALEAVENRRIHVCASCGLTVTAVGERLGEMPRTLARPNFRPPAGASIYLLPMWCVSVHTEQLGSVGSRMAAEIRVPAVGMARLPLLLNFGRNLTRAPLEWSQWEGMATGRDSAEVDAEAAFALAETIALRHVSDWPTEDEIETTEIPFGQARLVDWPCAIHGSELIELVAGLSCSHTLIEDAALRERSGDLGPAIASTLSEEVRIG